jgi:16S rRNA processing protein RimM
LTDNQARASEKSSVPRPSGSRASGAPKTSAPRRKRPPRPAPRPEQGKPLAETAGPEPATHPNETRLAIGVVVGTHGLRGELKIKLSTDDPERLADVKWVYISDQGTRRRLQSVRFHGGQALLKVQFIGTPEQANALRGEWIRISGKDARPLEENEFFYYQLVGLTAFDEDGNEVGTLNDIIETGTNDVFVIKTTTGEEMLVPNHPDFVPSIEPDQGRLIVRPPIYA